jgi:hypothetical protein
MSRGGRGAGGGGGGGGGEEVRIRAGGHEEKELDKKIVRGEAESILY